MQETTLVILHRLQHVLQMEVRNISFFYLLIDLFFQISNCTLFIEGVSKRINRPVFLLQKNVSDRAQYNDLQSLLCATLQVRIGHVKTVFFDILEVGIKFSLVMRFDVTISNQLS